jgi:hypothetical protein
VVVDANQAVDDPGNETGEPDPGCSAHSSSSSLL